MGTDKILITLGGFGLIGFIWWFFFGKRDEVVAAGEAIEILVDGGYKPENIEIEKGKTTKLLLKRTDSNSCLEEIIIPDFKIKRYLPLGEKVEIEIDPKEKGIFQIHCGMNMFHGKIIVK